MREMMRMMTVRIKNIWECDKIEKRGTKNEKDEGWICHWCDKDFMFGTPTRRFIILLRL
jgi:ribosomal protein L37AE/L43A